MRADKEKKEQKENRILARIMARELTEEQLKRVAGTGTCTSFNDGDVNEQ